jgi:hypothetical protein
MLNACENATDSAMFEQNTAIFSRPAVIFQDPGGSMRFMRYLLLVLLASIAIVACGNSDAPDCTSADAATALHDYLLDANEYSAPPDAQIQSFLTEASLLVGNFRTTSQDAGLHSSRCVASVTFKRGPSEVDEELAFGDHLPGDRIHVIDANLDSLRDKIRAAAH